MTDEPVEWPSRSPVARLEARELFRRIEARPLVARFFLSAAINKPRPERRNDAQMTEGTYHVCLTKAQTWERDVATSGHWREPSQPVPPAPWKQKKKR